MTEYSKEWHAGAQAGLADNYADIGNPYERDSQEWQDWIDGWKWGVDNWDMNMNDGG